MQNQGWRLSRTIARIARALRPFDAETHARLQAFAFRLAIEPLRDEALLASEPKLRRRVLRLERRLERALANQPLAVVVEPSPPTSKESAPRITSFGTGLATRLVAVLVLILVLLVGTANLVAAAVPGEKDRSYGRQDGFEFWAILASLLALAVWRSRRARFSNPLLVPATYVVPRWLDRLVTRMQGTAPLTEPSTRRPRPSRETEPPGEQPQHSTTLDRWLQSAIPSVLLLTSLFVSLLPLAAILRGAIIAISARASLGVGEWIGLSLAFVSLLLGSIFFAYSVKYYLSTAVIVGAAVLGGNREGRATAQQWKGLARINHWYRGERLGADGTPKLNLDEYPFISVHIAAYNESRVIERLLEACAGFDYPNYEVILVDDSTDEESLEILDRWRDRPGFKIMHRSSRDGFKGGALTLALKHVDPRTEYVAIFDADAVPFPDTLRRLLPHFYEKGPRGQLVSRPELAAVQSYQWHVLNKSEGWLTEAVRTEYSGSYMIERPFQEVLGSLKMIAGTAYMIRVARLRELGWGRSITEDWELTLRLYARGYKVAYTPYAETPAECVSTFGRLTKQRMRWAEGHSFNVRRHFGEIMRSKFLSPVEKIEFGFYTLYYLQAVLLLVGTVSWLASQFVFHAHIPEWTALMGYSLVFSNALSLPLMNLGGLMLEEAPRKDFSGIIGAVLLSYLLVPYQGWAALKGLFESEEGTWNRTPKTGRVTDPIGHLRKLRELRRWMLGRWSSNRRLSLPAPITATAVAGKVQKLAWLVVSAMALGSVILGVAATHAPTAYASPASLYLQTTNSGVNGLPGLASTPGGNSTFMVFGGNNGVTAASWATAPTYSTGTISAGDWSYVLDWGNGTCDSGANSCTVIVTVGYYSGCNASTNVCTGVATPLFAFAPFSLVQHGPGSNTFTATEPALPMVGCPCALYVNVASVNPGNKQWHFLYGGAAGSGSDSNLTTPTLPVPEAVLPFAGLGLAAPLLFGWVRRRRARQSVT